MLNLSIRLAITSLFLAATGCSREEERLLIPPPDGPRATARCLDRKDPDYYFAPGQINEARDDSFMRREWFATYLRVAKADSLSCGASSETYRLLFMPAFRNARIITIAFRNDNWILETADFGPDLLQNRKIDSPDLARSTRVLSQAEFERVRSELTLLDFWNEPQFRDNSEIMDGFALALEGRNGDAYRVVTKLNVADGYEKFACMLFELGRLPPLGEAVSLDCSNPTRKVPLP